jgi:hypothetical protein
MKRSLKEYEELVKQRVGWLKTDNIDKPLAKIIKIKTVAKLIELVTKEKKIL